MEQGVFQHTTDNKITMVVVPQEKVVEILNQIVRTFVSQEVTALLMSSGMQTENAGGIVMHPNIPDQHIVLEFPFMSNSHAQVPNFIFGAILYETALQNFFCEIPHTTCTLYNINLVNSSLVNHCM